MKKLKIFLLLSILLLCFGFALSSEVHAQVGPKEFEIGDLLPATTQLRISWTGVLYDFTFGLDTDNGNFNLISYDPYGDMIVYIDDIPVYDMDHGTWISPYNNTDHAYIDIDTYNWNESKRTISYYFADGNAKLFWEDVSYQDAYTLGYTTAKEYYGWYHDGNWYSGEQAWNMGNDYAREMYGYYDPITEQWLSVEEYLDLYGTYKMGQSDFYNNFDKYFIPAMIIVFGGAIVLTVLKVFKKRE